MDKKIIALIAILAILVISFGCISTKEVPLQENKTNVTPEPNQEVKVHVETPKVEEINIQYFAFHPNMIKISPGTTIVWKNLDKNTKYEIVNGYVENRKEHLLGEFESGEIYYGESWNHTFEKEGEYPFFMKGHNNLQGIIVVGGWENKTIQIMSPHFVGSIPPHNKTLDSLNEIWITFSVPINNTSKLEVYDLNNKKFVEPNEMGVDISNNLRIYAKFDELNSSLFKVIYHEVRPEGEYYGQFFFKIE